MASEKKIGKSSKQQRRVDVVPWEPGFNQLGKSPANIFFEEYEKTTMFEVMGKVPRPTTLGVIATTVATTTTIINKMILSVKPEGK